MTDNGLIRDGPVAIGKVAMAQKAPKGQGAAEKMMESEVVLGPCF
jgi:hypothetical protein